MIQRRTASSTVAIGTASLFLALAAVASFLSEDAKALGAAWSLRGSLAPSVKVQARASAR